MKNYNEYQKSGIDNFINSITRKNISDICFQYLESKAFKEKTKAFLINRWSKFTEDEIIDDLLSLGMEIMNVPFPDKKYSAFYWICSANCVEIIPLEIIKKLPLTVWDESIIDTHGTNDMTKFEYKTLKQFLLDKRKTPSEIKNYLQSI